MKMFDKQLIPPKEFQIMKFSEKNFEAIGNAHVNYFIKHLGLKPNDHVLEIGSGNGRIAAALTRYLNSGKYVGVDVMKPFIKWCQGAYKAYPNFQFKHINVFNKKYNKASFKLARSYNFPFPNNAFDFIYLTSVFTHMHEKDVENYIKEISRMLKPNAPCFITYFLIDRPTLRLIDEGASTRRFHKHSQHSYTDNQQIAESAIAYDKAFIESLYNNYGLRISHIEEGRWRNPAAIREVPHNQDRVIAWNGSKMSLPRAKTPNAFDLPG